MPATFKIVLAAKPDSDGLFDVRLRITVNRITRFQNTGVAITDKQWNPKATERTENWVRTAHRQHETYNKDLVRWLTRAHNLVQENPGWDADQLKAALRNGDVDPNAGDFIAFCHKRLDEEQALLDAAHAKRQPTTGLAQGTIDVRRPVVKKLATWHRGPLPYPLLTPELMKKYERYLLTELGNDPSTVSKNLKTLHIFVVDAIRAKHLKPHADPFLYYEYPVSKSKQVWLEQKEVVDFETVPLPPQQHLARTVYFLQHYCHGSRIGVMLRLRWRDVAHGRLRFTMDKGGTEKSVEVTPELQALLDSLRPADGKAPKPTAYILPYLPAEFDKLHPREQLTITKRETSAINANLKRVMRRLGIEKKLSSHVARRTLATLGARALSGDLVATGGLLGHKRTSTTEIYLRDMDTFEVDAAARTVYAALRAVVPGTTPVQHESDSSEHPSVQSSQAP
jgi:integrase/recombinase XerD